MRVLLIRLSSLGDVVLATAAVEALHAQRPEVEVDVLTKPPFREVFRNHPGVHRTLPWRPEEGLFPLARELRRGGYEWIVDLHRNLRTAALRLLVRRPRWSVYRKGIWRRRLAVWLRRPEWLGGQPHVVKRYLAALEPLGVRDDGALPRVYPSGEDEEHGERRVREAGWDGEQPCVALAPGARWATKTWPEEHWVDLVSRLVQPDVDGFPVLVGGAEEQKLCGRILAGRRGANLAGEIGILQAAAVLKRCEVLITNDSAPLHLATAAGTPVIALFGPTHPGFGFYPLGPSDVLLEREETCRPCSLHGDARCPRGHHACLRDLSAGEVLRVGSELLPRRGCGRERRGTLP